MRGKEGRKEGKTEEGRKEKVSSLNEKSRDNASSFCIGSILGQILTMVKGLPTVPESLVESMTSFLSALNESSKVEIHWLQ